MGLVAFSLMLVVAAFECRDQTASILRMETFDNNIVNLTIVVELALALLIARGGALTSLLGTVPLSGRQWLIGAAPAVLLFILWELGKLIARRGRARRRRHPPRRRPPRLPQRDARTRSPRFAHVIVPWTPGPGWVLSGFSHALRRRSELGPLTLRSHRETARTPPVGDRRPMSPCKSKMDLTGLNSMNRGRGSYLTLWLMWFPL